MDAERYSAQLEGESNLAPSATVSSVSLQEFYPYSLPFACTASHARPEGSAARGECVGVRPTSRTTQATARAPTGGNMGEMVFLLNSHRNRCPPYLDLYDRKSAYENTKSLSRLGLAPAPANETNVKSY
jgi:hypothetical protein